MNKILVKFFTQILIISNEDNFEYNIYENQSQESNFSTLIPTTSYEIHNETSSSTGPIHRQQTITTWSTMHNFFTITNISKTCNICKKIYKTTTSTGILKTHIHNKHSGILNQHEQTTLNFPIIDPHNSFNQAIHNKHLIQ